MDPAKNTFEAKTRFYGWCCSWLIAIAMACVACDAGEAGALRAGAAIVDATPPAFPVIVNGMFETRSASSAHDPINVRCVVVEQGEMRIAIAVVDSCMVPRDLLDRAKAAAEKSTGIPADHMLVSATHTHEAPAAMGALGTDADPEYVKFLPPRITLAIEQAAKNLQPAKVGWSSIDAPEFTYNRRWIYRPDRMRRDPFGELTVRAMMNPGFLSSDTTGISGPVDSQLSLLAFQSLDGKPIAMLANYSMHYFGAPMLSADYFGIFCDHFATAIGADKSNPAFVAIMSQGTSGDLTSSDYSQPKRKTITIEQYSDALVALAKKAYDGIAYHDKLPLAMKETKITLHRRVADAKRLEESKAIVAKMGDRRPKGLPEVYAREQLFLAANPTAELKLQAIRLGDLGITAIPNEVFSLTGLKLKSRSPLPATFTIELANGAEGYIPPPEQHKLGGYTTWAARTAGLEVQAEPKIVEAVLTLLEDVSGQPRRKDVDVRGAYAKAVAASKPAAFWPLGEMDGNVAADVSGNNHAGAYEDGIAMALDGPQFPATKGEGARAVHFAGGRMKAAVPNLGKAWSAEFWFWNGLANNARSITGYLLSRGHDGAEEAAGELLGIGGTSEAQGKLIFFNGRTLHQTYMGNTEIPLRSWNHVVLVRDGRGFAVYLNGNKTPEIEGQADIGVPTGVDEIFLGGRNDHQFNLEGRICQASVYSRALKADEVVSHYGASGMPARPNTENASIVPTQPLSPEESLKAIHVPDGFAVDLVAAEPQIMDPVAIAWGADGKLWVVEMADYPSGIDGKMKAGGRIRFLESTKGGGHYDKSTLFMDGINFPTGIIPWRKGVIVTAAPEIFYAEDTTGVGKADKKEVLYSGFREGNAQLRVNGLRWGVDGWIYCANGWSGGIVKSIKTGETVNINGHDFRIRPDEGLIELQSGMTESGRDCDDWGDWFGCDNSNPLFHFPLDDRYFRRNKLATPPPAKIQLEVPVNPKLYPRSAPQKRYHTFEHSDHFTSACSATIYRDHMLFHDKAGSIHAFTCEPVHNLVHHEIVLEAGVSFTAARPEAEKESEFFASEDQWCRPVMVRTGPDGALWVVDMYRYIIEHPDWLPPVGKAELAKYWRMGEDKGRIYRVYQKEQQQPRQKNRLDKEIISILTDYFGSRNGWERDTAQQLIVWRHDMRAVPLLENLIANCGFATARMTALCTLDLLGELKTEMIEFALKDENPAVRRQAVRLAETRAKKAPQLIDAAIKLVDDPDAKVRLQLACTLGEWDGANVGAALAKIAVKDADDVTISGAVMSSASNHYPAIASALVAAAKPMPPKMMAELMSMALSAGNRSVMATLLESITTPKDARYSAAQFQALAGWLDNLALHDGSLQKLRDVGKDDLSARLANIPAMFDSARLTAPDAARSADDRAAAAMLLGREVGKEADDAQRLAKLLTPQTPADVQLAAVKAIGKTGLASVPELLTRDWASHSPDVRKASLDVLLAREPWIVQLLKSIEGGKLAAKDLDLPRRNRLMNHHSTEIRALAAKILGDVIDPSRQKVVDAYLSALSLTGDAAHGKIIFTQNCATCHRLNGIGVEIGPNLLSVGSWAPDAVLVAILDPSRAVEPRYLGFNVALTDGDAIYGIITAEAPASITLKGLDGKERAIPRLAIKTLAGTNRSLMTDGLESALSKQDLADVIRFVLQSPGGN